MVTYSVGKKFMTLILLAAVLVLGVGIAGLRELQQLSGHSVQLAQAAQASQYAHAMDRDLQAISLALTEGMNRENASWFAEPLARPLADFQANTPLLIGLLDTEGQTATAETVRTLHATVITRIDTLTDLAARQQWNTGYLSLANEYLPAQMALLQQLQQLDVQLNQDVNQTTVVTRDVRIRAVRTIILALIGTVGLLGLASWLIWRNLVLPIQQITAAATTLAAGDYGVRAPATAREDEIGRLTRAFNGMADGLVAAQETLAQQVTERTADLQRALITVQQRTAHQEQLLRDLEVQRITIRELSIPTIPVTDDTLVIPLIGSLDTQRLREVQEIAMQESVRMRARWLLLDLTGVPIVDSQVAQGLMAVVQGAALLGTRAALIGVRPEVAQSMVGLGLDLAAVQVYRDLQTAIRATLRRT